MKSLDLFSKVQLKSPKFLQNDVIRGWRQIQKREAHLEATRF